MARAAKLRTRSLVPYKILSILLYGYKPWLIRGARGNILLYLPRMADDLKLDSGYIKAALIELVDLGICDNYQTNVVMKYGRGTSVRLRVKLPIGDWSYEQVNEAKEATKGGEVLDTKAKAQKVKERKKPYYERDDIPDYDRELIDADEVRFDVK